MKYIFIVFCLEYTAFYGIFGFLGFYDKSLSHNIKDIMPILEFHVVIFARMVANPQFVAPCVNRLYAIHTAPTSYLWVTVLDGCALDVLILSPMLRTTIPLICQSMAIAVRYRKSW